MFERRKVAFFDSVSTKCLTTQCNGIGRSTHSLKRVRATVSRSIISIISCRQRPICLPPGNCLMISKTRYCSIDIFWFSALRIITLASFCFRFQRRIACHDEGALVHLSCRIASVSDAFQCVITSSDICQRRSRRRTVHSGETGVRRRWVWHRNRRHRRFSHANKDTRSLTTLYGPAIAPGVDT